MDAGTLIWILLLGGGIVGMLFMHRGHAHRGHGGHGGCGGHDRTSAGEPQERHEAGRNPATSGSDGRQGTHAGGEHRGC